MVPSPLMATPCGLRMRPSFFLLSKKPVDSPMLACHLPSRPKRCSRERSLSATKKPSTFGVLMAAMPSVFLVMSPALPFAAPKRIFSLPFSSSSTKGPALGT
jgi:hypothetical protein